MGTLGPARHSLYYLLIVPLPAAIALVLGWRAWSVQNERSAAYSAAALILLVAVLGFSPAAEIPPMIVGLGSDLCNVERIEQSLERWATNSCSACSPRSSRRRRHRVRTLVPARSPKRFAAKEAFSKAVGTGFRRGVHMKDIGVVNLASGAPTLQLTGGAKARLDALAPEGHAIDIHLTMTDDYPWAQAFVILTARELEP